MKKLFCLCIFTFCFASARAEMTYSSISPLSGPLAGGGTLTIIGADFPYAQTSDYVQSGLVAHYDGINNTGGGDNAHSSTATTWSDLSGNENNVALSGALGNAKWFPNGFLFGDNRYFYRAVSAMAGDLPLANNNYTIEVVWDPSVMTNSDGGFIGWGCNKNTSQTNNLRFFGASASNQHFRHYWWDNDWDFTVPASANAVRNLSITYDNTLTRRTGYFNGAQFGTRTSSGKNTCASGNFMLGNTTNNEYGSGNKIFSIRVYNRPLSAAEAAANYEVDKKRFAQTPVAKIGAAACGSLVVNSASIMTCSIPAGAALGKYSVQVEFDGSSYSAGLYSYGFPGGFWRAGAKLKELFIGGKPIRAVYKAGKLVFEE